jgi:hypothetical protein
LTDEHEVAIEHKFELTNSVVRVPCSQAFQDPNHLGDVRSPVPFGEIEVHASPNLDGHIGLERFIYESRRLGI